MAYERMKLQNLQLQLILLEYVNHKFEEGCPCRIISKKCMQNSRLEAEEPLEILF